MRLTLQFQRVSFAMGSRAGFKNFNKNGELGNANDRNSRLELNMTLDDCVRIGKEKGWKFVSHRNVRHSSSAHKNTCFRQTNDRLNDWIWRNQDPILFIQP